MEFNDAQIERIDDILNSVFEMCKVLTENENLEWDMSIIGEIADISCDILVGHGYKIRYPVRITDENGNDEITDWHECEYRKFLERRQQSNEDQ